MVHVIVKETKYNLRGHLTCFPSKGSLKSAELLVSLLNVQRDDSDCKFHGKVFWKIPISLNSRVDQNRKSCRIFLLR